MKITIRQFGIKIGERFVPLLWAKAVAEADGRHVVARGWSQERAQHKAETMMR